MPASARPAISSSPALTAARLDVVEHARERREPDVSSGAADPAASGNSAAVARPMRGRTFRTAFAWLNPSLGALIDQAIVSGTNFLAAWMVGHSHGADELGRYSLAFSVMVLAMNVHVSLVASPFTYFANHFSGVRRKALCGSALVLHVILTFASIPVLLLAAAAFSYFADSAHAAPGLLAVAAVLAFILLRELARRVAFAELNTAAVIAIDGLSSLLQIGCMWRLARTGDLTTSAAMACAGLGAAVTGIGWLIAARGEFAVGWKCLARDTRQSWQFGKWVLADQMLAVCGAYAPQWLLFAFCSTTAVGVFTACSLVIQLANPIILGLANVFEPSLSGAAARGGVPEIRRHVRRISLHLSWAIGGLSALFLVIGDPLIHWLYREKEFQHDPLVIVLLVLAMLANGVGLGVFLGLRAMRHSNVNVAAGAVALAVTILVAAFGAQTYGALAGALGVLFGNLAALGVRLVAFRMLTHRSLSLGTEAAS